MKPRSCLSRFHPAWSAFNISPQAFETNSGVFKSKRPVSCNKNHFSPDCNSMPGRCPAVVLFQRVKMKAVGGRDDVSPRLPWRSSRPGGSPCCRLPSSRRRGTVPRRSTESCGPGRAWPADTSSDSKSIVGWRGSGVDRWDRWMLY